MAEVYEQHKPTMDNILRREGLAGELFIKRDFFEERLAEITQRRQSKGLQHSYYVLGSKYGDKANEDVFPDMMEQNVVSVEFARDMDFSDVFQQTEAQLKDYLNKQGLSTHSVTCLKHFLSLKKGDKIAVKSDGSPKGNQGYLKIVGIAEVVGDYPYQYNPDGLGHTVSVKWLEAPVSREYNLGGYGSTLRKVTDPQVIDLIFNHSSETADSKTGNTMSIHPLNQIFYGPPGTGKTYSTKYEAVKIIEGDNAPAETDRAEILERYNKYFNEGRIVFTTFHQSMSYEDFVEGIKPDTDKGSGQIRYETRPGIFKRICETATTNFLESQIKESIVPFSQAFSRLKEDFETSADDELNIDMKRDGYQFTITDITENNIPFKKHSGGTAHSLSIKTLEDFYYGRRSEIGGLQSYYVPLAEKLREYAGKETKREIQLQNYVLIIDEINRGNIAAILGELITLLEPDKRIGAKEEIRLDLPYSDNEVKFGVPPNLHIIGTMNTADRSVEALDTALRRRFKFTEVMPRPELLSPAYMVDRLLWDYKDVDWDDEKYVKAEESLFNLIGAPQELWEERKHIWDARDKEQPLNKLKEFNYTGLNLQYLLETINTRVEQILDRDHGIGHSYLLNVCSPEDLARVFTNEVIPLLQEYFFGDPGKIGLLLGEGFIELEKRKQDVFAPFKDYDYKTQLSSKKVWHLKAITAESIIDALKQGGLQPPATEPDKTSNE